MGYQISRAVRACLSMTLGVLIFGVLAFGAGGIAKAQSEAGLLVGDRGILFEDLQQRAEGHDQGEQPLAKPMLTSTTLSARDRKIALAAWAYFRANLDRASGLVSSFAQGRFVSLPDVGETIAAIESARTMGLLSKAQYDRHVRLLVASLARLSAPSGLPPALVRLGQDETLRARSGPSEGGLYPSGNELANLMLWLHVSKENAPYLANAIDHLVASWHFCRLRSESRESQNFSQDYLTRKAFQLWGFELGFGFHHGVQAPEMKSVQALEIIWRTQLGYALPLAIRPENYVERPLRDRPLSVRSGNRVMFSCPLNFQRSHSSC